MRAVNQPTSWWGWHWEPPTPMSIIELIQAGNMPARLAAMFWVGMERGASIIVAADPPSAGKTTTLSALLSFTPPETLVYFTRGVGESFALPPVSGAHPTYILINEMSDHIPVYTWDDNARKAFQLLAEGYALATTMHADSVDGVLEQLTVDLRVPPVEVANLTFVVPLYIGHREQHVVRRVQEVSLLRANRGVLSKSTIASWSPESDEFEVLSTAEQKTVFAAWSGFTPQDLTSEIDRREGFLGALEKTGATTITEVNSAIEQYYEQVIQPKL